MIVELREGLGTERKLGQMRPFEAIHVWNVDKRSARCRRLVATTDSKLVYTRYALPT